MKKHYKLIMATFIAVFLVPVQNIYGVFPGINDFLPEKDSYASHIGNFVAGVALGVGLNVSCKKEDLGKGYLYKQLGENGEEIMVFMSEKEDHYNEYSKRDINKKDFKFCSVEPRSSGTPENFFFTMLTAANLGYDLLMTRNICGIEFDLSSENLGGKLIASAETIGGALLGYLVTEYVKTLNEK